MNDNKNKIIMLRADIDGLKIKENNPHLTYQTCTNYHHGCGHDGHIACLVSAALFFWKNKDKIPSNNILRILFQPDEEIGNGA